MQRLVVLLIFLLAILHQDFWWWSSQATLFGFLPVGLAWHTGISLAAATVGWLAIKFCWPQGLDEDESSPPSPDRPADEEGE